MELASSNWLTFNYYSLAILFLLLSILYGPLESLGASGELLGMQYNPTTGSSRVLILTAHPDDECLFFAPTILTILSQIRQSLKTGSDPEGGLPQNSNTAAVYSLCLSIGDAEGLGGTRQAELSRSLDQLGIEPNNRWVIDHPNLRDSISSQWSPSIIADVLRPYIIKYQITTILTFDEGGISGHPNHKSLPEGVKHFLSFYNVTSNTPSPKLFTLITVPVFAKYTNIFGPLLAKTGLYRVRILRMLESQRVRLARRFGLEVEKPDYVKSMPVMVSGLSGYYRALQAMREHKSQLVWFRWLYVSFSRYMWVNEWIEIPVDSNLSLNV